MRVSPGFGRMLGEHLQGAVTQMYKLWVSPAPRSRGSEARTLSHWEGNGNSLQCSCLENFRDGGASWAAVYGVAQSRTLLKRLSSILLKEGRNILRKQKLNYFSCYVMSQNWSIKKWMIQNHLRITMLISVSVGDWKKIAFPRSNCCLESSILYTIHFS